jgi:hypothetical protein
VMLPYGHDPARPMSDESLVTKFRECASHAAIGLSDAAIDRVIDVVMHLERVSDVREVTDAMSPA